MPSLKSQHKLEYRKPYKKQQRKINAYKSTNEPGTLIIELSDIDKRLMMFKKARKNKQQNVSRSTAELMGKKAALA